MAKLSIIIPVFNVEKYIHKCIDSIRNQTIEDIEIILIDDGSEDSSAAICDMYALQDNRIKVIHQKMEDYVQLVIKELILLRLNIYAF